MPILGEINQSIDNMWSMEDEDYSFLDRLSLYATLRPGDLKDLGLLHKKPKKTEHKCRQSLQDLFRGPHTQVFSPDDDQTPVIEEKEEQTSSCESLNEHVVVVHGQDIQDLPIEYQINGLREHEMPVKGFYVDERICPGFTYKVRYVGSDECVFDDESRVLQSIGIGYGKRLTFKGEKLNLNDSYFWSDSHPEGFAFAIQAVKNGDKFVVYNSANQVVGDITVEKVEIGQFEESTECEKGQVKKLVRVRFGCMTNYHTRHHGVLMEVSNHNYEVVEGIAEVTKSKGSREAVTNRIVNVVLPRIGSCSLWKEV